jgi:hypothetical protein
MFFPSNQFMKITGSILLISILLAESFTACKKNSNTASQGALLMTLSKSSAKLEEPVYASTNVNDIGHGVIKWSVNPSSNNWVSSSAGKSVILFSSPGQYSVTANYFSDSAAQVPSDSSSSPVTVTDSLYTDTVAFCNVAVSAPVLSGDQIILTPLNSLDTGLVLLAHTQGVYPNVPVINYTITSFGQDGYAFVFNSIEEFPCYVNNGPTPATTILYLGKLDNGNYSIQFSLFETNYSGTLSVTNAGFSFTWNYSSGVVISPPEISR